MTIKRAPRRWASLIEARELEGQGLVEYALVLILVVLAAIGALTAFGVGVSEGLYGLINAALPFF